MIEVSAYKFMSEGIFRNTQNSMPINNFTGNCMVYFDDGAQMIFETGINEDGERYWFANGNNPKKEYRFI